MPNAPRLRSRSRLAALTLAFLSAVTLIGAQDRPAGAGDAKAPLRPRLHLASDKPMYRPGETAYFRGMLLDAFRHAPAADGATADVQIKSPKGDIVVQEQIGVDRAVLGFSWQIPKEQPGGEYALVASFPWHGLPPAEMKFDVRSYRAPRLRTDLQFLRKGYGPGEDVEATLTVSRAEGGIPAGAPVTVIARVDGAEVYRSTIALDAQGICTARFSLPREMTAGDGSLAMAIQDGGVQETAARTIPIVLNKVAIEFFPEGGDLVAGLHSRVYFEARDPRQKPADVTGRVLDAGGATVAELRADHEGRGVFGFTPRAGERYVVALDRPAGNVQRFALPAVAERGWTLRSAADAYGPAEAIRFAVAGTQAGRVRLILSKLDVEVAQSSAELGQGRELELNLTPPLDVYGVLRATLFAGDRPVAERLVFRRPDRALKISLVAVPERATPGAHVRVEVRTTDASGKPVPAMVGLAATDDAVLEQVEKRERAPRLPVQVLLGQDVRELADAHVYLSDAAEAPRAIDRLLGTQGWRRFAAMSLSEFLRVHGDLGRRALAVIVPPPPRPAAAPGGKGGVEMEAVALGARGADERAQNEGAPAEGEAVPVADAAPDAQADDAKNVAAKDAGLVAGEEGDRVGKLVAAEEMAEEPKLKQDMGGGFAGREGARMRREMMVAWVRVYAHAARPNRAPNDRSDFTETVYWNAGLATDAQGKATFEFDLSDAVTSFRLRADGFGADGALGEADLLVESRKPFYLEPKLPLEVTAGDLIEVPVALANGTAEAMLARLETKIGAGITREGNEPELSLTRDSSGRLFLTLVAGKHNGDVAVTLAGRAGAHSDTVTRTVAVVPFGFPIAEAFGGRLAAKASHAIEIPAGVEPSSLVTEARLYPSPMASLTEALSGLLREPGGCFEQTSSNAYPNIMVMQYLKSHHVTDTALVARANDLLDRGYKKLVGFECPQKGYEWFGGDPGHEALTAYGVMEFKDMAAVYPVDDSMLRRTRDWLLSRRDGKGGFTRNPRALDSFGGAPDDITAAYIVWALQQAGETGLAAEIAGVKERAGKSDDAYLLALSANVLLTAKDDGALPILDKLTGKQEQDGAVRGAATSITRSGGECLEVETTSLAILAWLQAPGHEKQLDAAARWLFEVCKGGRFGATQSTIMALKAILGYDAAMARPKAPGSATLKIDGQAVKDVAFGPDTHGALDLGSFADRLTPGSHTIELEMKDGSEMPYAVLVRYHAVKPANHPACKVRLSTALSAPQVREGETLDLAVELANLTQEGQPMTVAIVGLPGGLEPRHDQLKELVKAGTVDFFETRGREVILYKRCMKPAETVKLSLNLIAAVPGRYTGPASRAYLYYTDDQKQWCDGLAVTVQRAGE